MFVPAVRTRVAYSQTSCAVAPEPAEIAEMSETILASVSLVQPAPLMSVRWVIMLSISRSKRPPFARSIHVFSALLSASAAEL